MFIARQRLLLSAFTYDLIDEAGQAIGALCWPDFPVARNARLKSAVPKSLTTRIFLICHGQTYDVEYEHLIRDWHNDIRFFLTAGGGTLAAADGIRSAKRFARHDLTLTQLLSASLVRTSGFFFNPVCPAGCRPNRWGGCRENRPPPQARTGSRASRFPEFACAMLCHVSGD